MYLLEFLKHRSFKSNKIQIIINLVKLVFLQVFKIKIAYVIKLKKMTTLTDRINALSMAFEKVDLQLLPVGEEKIPKFKRWQEGKFNKEEIIARNPTALGVRMGDSDFETVDVDSKNAQDPKVFKKEFIERFKQSGLDRSKFIVQSSQSGGFHLVYRTGIRTRKKKIAKDPHNRTLIEIISEGMYLQIYNEEAFYNIAELEYLTSSEYHTLLSLCYSFNRHTSTTGSFQKYNPLFWAAKKQHLQ